MSVRNLDKMFHPRSVAVIGASDRPNSVGHALMTNLLRGGFEGPVLPVNPRAAAVHGIMAYQDVASLPLTPDLAVIATPPDTVPALVAALAGRGTRAAVILTAGFSEGEAKAGKERTAQMLDAARPHLLRLVGPNCLGLAIPGIGLNATFAPAAILPGHVALLTQSGAMATTVLDWALPRGIGFSAIVSMGDMSDALCRSRHSRAQVHVGGAAGGARQAGDRGQGRPCPGRRACGRFAYRRARRGGCRL
jgi:acetyltransferase